MTALDAYLATCEDRCPGCGFHPAHQGCRCESDEWGLFAAAIRQATRADGRVSQSDVRPLIRGRIAPKHIGTLYRRAVAERLLTPVGWERSTDHLGGNADKQQRVYAAAST